MAEMNIWDKFNRNFDVKKLADDVKEIEKNGNSYKTVPYGDYEVKVEKIDLTEAKSTGNPKVVMYFRVLNGEYKNSIIFMHQVISYGEGIHAVNDILRGMDTGIRILFEDYEQYHNLLMDVMEAIDGKFEFALSYKEGKNGFSTYEITEVFELE